MRSQSLDTGLYRQEKRICLLDSVYWTEANLWRILIVRKVIASLLLGLVCFFVFMEHPFGFEKSTLYVVKREICFHWLTVFNSLVDESIPAF